MHLIDVHTSRQLRVLRPLLVAWTRAVKRYCQLEKYDDNPWWFNERASLSTLAGAAWSIGWSALEEFNTRKRGGIIPKEKAGDGTRHGRCDLYIASKNCGFALEAKQAWYPMGARNNIARLAMENAWRDAGRLNIDEADHRLAATFVVPHFSRRRAGDTNHLASIEKWLHNEPFSTSRPPTARAWAHVFFKESFISERNGRAFPGVILLIEKRQRASRRASEKR